MTPADGINDLVMPELNLSKQPGIFTMHNFYAARSRTYIGAAVLFLALIPLLHSSGAFSLKPDNAVYAATLSGFREDFNGDGSVNIEDVLSLLAFGRENRRDPLADYNGDGKFSITDPLSLLINIGRGKLSAAGDPNDDAVKNSPNIIFYEDCENGDLPTVEYGETGGFYDLNGYPTRMRITSEEAAVGGHSLELVHPAGVISPQWLHRKFPGQDSIFVRFYRKFDKDYIWPPLGAHDTYIFAGNYVSPTSTDLSLYLDIPQGPVIRIDKGNWDLSRQPELVLRSAFQGPGLDYGTGHEIISHLDFDNYHGLPYNVRTAPLLEADRWYCFEYMAKMNSGPGVKDGEVRLWIDGWLITEMKGLILRNDSHTYAQWNHWML
ncbi:MAG TPA: hypothetical protein VJ417_16225, partial [Candidatus Glassbacteria bacterium]|nr:hypothetical protein [Candidatus Glassbacteria bacterium]